MVSRSTDLSIVKHAIWARRKVAEGPADLSATWLAEADRVAVAEESGALLDPEDIPRLVTALHLAGVPRLVAVTNDPLLVEDEVYELATTAEDLNALSSECGGMNMLLLPIGDPDLAVLCTVDDFLLVAGSRMFVSSYVDGPEARRAFLSFVDSHSVEELRPVLRRAARYMDWIDDE